MSDPDLELSRIRAAGMQLLSRREYSARELADRMQRKFPGQSGEIDRVLEELADQRLQSDRRLCESMIHWRVSKGQGPLKIRAALRGKQVPESLIEEAFETAGVDWGDQARLVRSRKFGDADLSDRQRRARAVRFLQARGSTLEQALRAL